MEFWGVEVKAGETLKVCPGEGKVIHLSQASIGESKRGKDESVPVYVKVDEQKLVIGTLSADKFPQIQYDVVFEKDFELSHNWKNGSVFFCGYRTQNPGDDEGYSGDEFESESEEEAIPLENGKPTPAIAGSSKPAPVAKPASVEDSKGDSDEDSSDGFSGSDDDLSDDEDDKMDADDSDGDDSSEEDEKTPTPKKESKKRPNETETKSAVSSKKVKLATPQKTDGKKVAAAHTATPHPAKQAGKTPKSETPKTPATAGKVTCNSCSKTFNSDKALDSHSKAKHAAK